MLNILATKVTVPRKKLLILIIVTYMVAVKRDARMAKMVLGNTAPSILA